jgi:hypothetical protein
MDTPSATDGMKMGEDKGSDSGTSLPEPVRIIHKEQDSISAFCLNQVCDCFLNLLFHAREVKWYFLYFAYWNKPFNKMIDYDLDDGGLIACRANPSEVALNLLSIEYV